MLFVINCNSNKRGAVQKLINRSCLLEFEGQIFILKLSYHLQITNNYTNLSFKQITFDVLLEKKGLVQSLKYHQVSIDCPF
jgi:hypothetical protein